MTERPRHGSLWRRRAHEWSDRAVVRVDDVERREGETLLDYPHKVRRVSEFVAFRYVASGQPSKLSLDSFLTDFEPLGVADPLAWRERLAEVEL